MSERIKSSDCVNCPQYDPSSPCKVITEAAQYRKDKRITDSLRAKLSTCFLLPEDVEWSISAGITKILEGIDDLGKTLMNRRPDSNNSLQTYTRVVAGLGYTKLYIEQPAQDDLGPLVLDVKIDQIDPTKHQILKVEGTSRDAIKALNDFGPISECTEIIYCPQ